MDSGTIILACAVTAVTITIMVVLFMKAQASRPLADAAAREASAEARHEELRNRLDDAQRDFVTLREELSGAVTSRSVAEARLEEATRGFDKQRQILDEAKTKLSDAFKALAADALSQNSKGFLTIAEEQFKRLRDGAQSDLDARKTAIAHLINPLHQALDGYQEQARVLEATRLKETSAVGEQLRSLALAQTTLQEETAKLVNALRSPQVRGRWGEITLRRTAELAGMSRHCDFVEQESVTTEDGRLRPDMIVRLPAGREVVVDSKVSLAGFLEALEAKSDSERDRAMDRHALQIKQHVASLSSKEYWNQFPTAPEFVVMFIPNDSFLAAAAERDPSIVESALSRNVVIATPTTFIALLRAIAFGWRQEVIAESAQKISLLGQELSDRLATVTDHFADLGKSIGRSVDSYNAAVASFESRLLSTARKFKELGVEGKKAIKPMEPVDQIPRQVGTSFPDVSDQRTAGQD